MQFLKDNKAYIGLILIAGIGLWVYMTYFPSSTPNGTITATEASPLSPDVLATLTSLNSIKLDSTIFSDPVFASLTDFYVAIPSQDSGRRNPFAPI
jgi:hypothetical protein